MAEIGCGVHHGMDVSFVWGESPATASKSGRNLSVAMNQYWTNFAKYGDPNVRGDDDTKERGVLPVWPVYDIASDENLVFGASGEIVKGSSLSKKACDFIDALPPL